MTCILGKPFSCDCSITSCLLLFLSVDCETCDYTISTSEEAPPDYTPAQRFPVCKLRHTHVTLTQHWQWQTHWQTTLTHTLTHWHTHWHTDTLTDTQTHTQSHWHTHRQTLTLTHTLTDTHTDRQTHWQTGQTHRHTTLTDWQTDRHTHIDMLQTYTDRHTHTHTNRQTDIQTHWQTGRLTKPSTIRSRPVIPIAYCLNTSPPVSLMRGRGKSQTKHNYTVLQEWLLATATMAVCRESTNYCIHKLCECCVQCVKDCECCVIHYVFVVWQVGLISVVWSKSFWRF